MPLGRGLLRVGGTGAVVIAGVVGFLLGRAPVSFIVPSGAASLLLAGVVSWRRELRARPAMRVGIATSLALAVGGLVCLALADFSSFANLWVPGAELLFFVPLPIVVAGATKHLRQLPPILLMAVLGQSLALAAGPWSLQAYFLLGRAADRHASATLEQLGLLAAAALGLLATSAVVVMAAEKLSSKGLEAWLPVLATTASSLGASLVAVSAGHSRSLSGRLGTLALAVSFAAVLAWVSRRDDPAGLSANQPSDPGSRATSHRALSDLEPPREAVLKVWYAAFASTLAAVSWAFAEVAISGRFVGISSFAYLGVIGIIGGVASRYRRLADLLDQAMEDKERLGSFVDGSSDLLTLVSESGEVIWQNAAITKLTGAPPGSAVGRSVLELFVEEDRGRVATALRRCRQGANELLLEARIQRLDGTFRHTETVLRDRRQDRWLKGFVLVTRDVHDRVGLRRQLFHEARHDALTNLANRRAFLAATQRELARPSSRATLILIDLDGFKEINDRWGHDIGDELLRQVADRLRSVAKHSDVVSRLGGDEFAFLVTSSRDPAKVADELLSRFASPFELGGLELAVTCSAGLARAEPGMNLSELLRRADIALYKAKEEGRTRWVDFQPELERAVHDRYQLVAGMRSAIEHGQFSLVYQPIHHLPDRAVVGAEALVRWHHPLYGELLPQDFVPLAEEVGLVAEIGNWALGKALEQAATWREVGVPLQVFVNVSARQCGPDLTRVTADLLGSLQLDPAMVVLELTETADLDPAAVRSLVALHRLGVKIALDHFGIHHSNLLRLAEIEVDLIKIDSQFLNRSADRRTLQILRAMLQLTRSMGLRPLGEGVESEKQLKLLERVGCDLAQGVWLSPVQTPEEVARLAVRSAKPTLGPQHRDVQAASAG
jgi:diguanylate cyclase (GGDEF)-like protein/PAS domain S-box-containing protein